VCNLPVDEHNHERKTSPGPKVYGSVWVGDGAICIPHTCSPPGMVLDSFSSNTDGQYGLIIQRPSDIQFQDASEAPDVITSGASQTSDIMFCRCLPPQVLDLPMVLEMSNPSLDSLQLNLFQLDLPTGLCQLALASALPSTSFGKEQADRKGRGKFYSNAWKRKESRGSERDKGTKGEGK
jgi:hypothetical protein